MPSTNKTPNLGLSQWALTDKPAMEDFNQAFAAIDTALFECPDKKSLSLNSGFSAMDNRECVCYKNLFSEVTVNISTHIEAGTLKAGEKYAAVTTLPKGYRPAFIQRQPLVIAAGDGIYDDCAVGWALLTSDGVVTFYVPRSQGDVMSKATNTSVQFSFVSK